ncbi:MAG: DUF4173 domain-containing protein [Anaerolineaceae bacterium]
MQTYHSDNQERPGNGASGPMPDENKTASPDADQESPVVLGKPVWILLLVFCLALLMDRILFYRQPGAQWAIFVNGVLAIVFISAALERKRIPISSVLLALPVGASAALTMFRSEAFTLMSLILFSILGTILLAVSLLNGQGLAYRLREYAGQGLRLVASVLVGLPAGLTQSTQHAKATGGGSKSANRRSVAVLRGILIALPLVALLGVLLASADAVFSSHFSSLLNWIKIEKPEEFIFRLIFMLGLSYALFGLVWHALTKTGEKLALEPDQPLLKPFLGMTESAIILFALNALLATFVLVQIKYFFAGAQNITLEGFTYAEYARRGFFELVVAAIITLLVHYGLASLTRREDRRRKVFFSILASLLLLQTGVILVSAFQRLSLYEAAYGFTQARLTAHVFMVFLGLGLALSIVMEITRTYKHLAVSLLLVLLAFGLTLSFLNVDRTIARQNIQHAQAGNELDLAYLAGGSLSEDAAPELFEAFDDPALSPELRDSLGLALSCRSARFTQNSADVDFWASWHASRAAAGRLYLSRAEDLAEYPLQNFSAGKGFLVEGSPFICVYSESMP